jgi:hypothetical protein
MSLENSFEEGRPSKEIKKIKSRVWEIETREVTSDNTCTSRY